MDRNVAKLVAVLGGLAAALAAIASAAGVLLRGDLTTVEFVSVRGEVVQVVTEGIYRFNAEGIVAEGIGWDLVTLLVVAPVTFAALMLMVRGSVRATLVVAGLLAYLCYQYAEYAVFWAYGPLYPLYVATLALSVSSLGLLVYGLDLASIREGAGRPFPRRAVTAFSGLVVLILAGLWLPVVAGTLGGVVTDELQGASTLVVPAFDLGLLVPLAVFTGLAVHRRLPVGYLLGSIVLVKGASMALAIAAMLVVESLVTAELLMAPLVVFAAVAVLSLALGVRALRSLEQATLTDPPGSEAVDSGPLVASLVERPASGGGG